MREFVNYSEGIGSRVREFVNSSEGVGFARLLAHACRSLARSRVSLARSLVRSLGPWQKRKKKKKKTGSSLQDSVTF